ncbi:MAG: nucleoside triphosphate pyrophosphohydrolase [Verrucomicrobiaceae bacterium]|nr:nucleoside triphosphate pyrophosphohydrolase [Verrucomicrobiaceae bacterium]
MSEAFNKLRDVVARLRAPDGCPWDREQTNDSLVPKLLEEAYEVAHAAREQDDENLREELGDVLLLVLMHAQIAGERGALSIEQVLEEVTAKLIRRHPHVFGESEAHDASAVVHLWEGVKHLEKQGRDKHYLAGVAAALPALMRAQKVQSKAARVHFDWHDVSDVVAKVDEELSETKEALTRGAADEIAEEIGDLLFAVVNLARKSQLESETLLQAATDKFVRRFNALEDELRARGKKLGEIGLEELDAIWNAQKAPADVLG